MEGVSERMVAVGQKEDEGMALRDREERDWSELPSDIVGHIMGKLYWSDRIRMHAVCKSWLQVPLHWIPTIDKAAWLMSFVWLRKSWVDGVFSVCKLRDTSVGKTVYIDNGIKGKERAIFDRAYFETARYGWVLFRTNPGCGFCQFYCFFLYSPFTNEVIELPELDIGRSPAWGCYLVATFYLSSANSECLVFCLFRSDEGIVISTCHPGDEAWKTLKFPDFYPGNRYSLPLSATYLAGSFYCLFSGGELGAFNLALQDWTLLVKYWPGPHPYYIHYFSAELIAIPRCPCLPYKLDKLFKFDFSEKRWVEELNMKELVHPDLTILSSSQAMGELPNTDQTFDLYAYIFPEKRNPPNKLKLILIEPPLNGVWRRRDLVCRS